MKFYKPKKDILNGNIVEQILLITIPITGTYLLQQLYQFVDSIVLGRFASVEALAAIGGSGNMVVNVILNIICGIATGVMIVVAQNYGRGDYHKVSEAVKTGMFIAVVFGGLITILSIVTARPLLQLMNVPTETINPSLIYMCWYFIGIIPYTIYQTGMYILRASGDTKISLLFTIIIAATKIIFDLLLTAVLDLGIWGVSIATFLSYLICGIVVLVILHRTTDLYQYDIKNFGFEIETLKSIFKIGTPIAIQSAVFAITSTVVSIRVNEFGTNAVAAFGAYNNVDNFYWSFTNGIGAAIVTIVGQNYGNRNMPRVKDILRKSIMIHFVASIIIGLFEYTCGKFIFSVFTTSIDVINIADRMVKFITFTYPLYILVEMISGTIKGCGDSMNSMIIAIIGVCVVRLLYLTLFNFTDVVEVLYCYPLSWSVTSIMYLIYYLANKKYRLSKTN